jgi:hypothetical protein
VQDWRGTGTIRGEGPVVMMYLNNTRTWSAQAIFPLVHRLQSCNARYPRSLLSHITKVPTKLTLPFARKDTNFGSRCFAALTSNIERQLYCQGNLIVDC